MSDNKHTPEWYRSLKFEPESREEFLKEVASTVGKDRELWIDHSQMEWPEALSEYDYAKAQKEAERKKTAHLKREFWKRYRDGLREALSQNKQLQLGYDWDILFYKLNFTIDKLRENIITESMEGIHPTDKLSEGELRKLDKKPNTHYHRKEEITDKYWSLREKFDKESDSEILSRVQSWYSGRFKGKQIDDKTIRNYLDL